MSAMDQPLRNPSAHYFQLVNSEELLESFGNRRFQLLVNIFFIKVYTAIYIYMYVYIYMISNIVQ